MCQISTLAAHLLMLLKVVFALSAPVLKNNTTQETLDNPVFSIVPDRHNYCWKNI